MQIRPFDEADYPALARAYALTYPDAPRGEAELRYLDERQKPPYKYARWVAEAETITGWCEYTQHPSWYHPDKYDVALAVVPAARGRGLGTRLYERLLSALAPHRPQAFRTNVLESCAGLLAFLQRRGFAETQRSWVSVLELERFSLETFADTLARADRAGFEVTSVAALEADEARLGELYTFYQELVADLPRTQPYTPWTFEQFVAHRRNSPVLLPEGSFIAHRGGTLAAVSELKKTTRPDQLQTGLTAVRRAFRGQGLALLCKIYAAAYAQKRGVKEVTARNAASNGAMLRINERLGFVRGVADIELVKTFTYWTSCESSSKLVS